MRPGCHPAVLLMCFIFWHGCPVASAESLLSPDIVRTLHAVQIEPASEAEIQQLVTFAATLEPDGVTPEARQRDLRALLIVLSCMPQRLRDAHFFAQRERFAASAATAAAHPLTEVEIAGLLRSYTTADGVLAETLAASGDLRASAILTAAQRQIAIRRLVVTTMAQCPLLQGDLRRVLKQIDPAIDPDKSARAYMTLILTQGPYLKMLTLEPDVVAGSLAIHFDSMILPQ
jgi:hypothetical protein